MTWVRRARWLVGVLLACLSIPFLGGQAAWAGTVTDQHTGWALTTTLNEGQSSLQSFSYTRPAAVSGDLTLFRTTVCGAAAGTGAQTHITSELGAWVTAGTFSSNTNNCTSPNVLMAMRLVVMSSRTTSTVLQWMADAQPRTGTNAAVASPSPYPSPVVTPSPYPVPGPTETWYAYPTPPAGGGTVGSCGGPEQDPCTIATVAGQGIELSEGQALPLFLFLGLLLMVALTTFLLRQGRALRV